MAVYEIPLSGTPQVFSIAWASRIYKLRFTYCDAPNAGWILDISDDVSDQPLVCGIPLVPGVDLLAQYDYLGFTEQLYVVTNDDYHSADYPTFLGLGSNQSHVYIQV